MTLTLPEDRGGRTQDDRLRITCLPRAHHSPHIATLLHAAQHQHLLDIKMSIEAQLHIKEHRQNLARHRMNMVIISTTIIVTAITKSSIGICTGFRNIMPATDDHERLLRRLGSTLSIFAPIQERCIWGMLSHKRKTKLLQRFAVLYTYV